MNGANDIHGACLCGAVTVKVRNVPATFSACHCGKCTHWSGGVQFFLEVAEGDATVSGPVKTWRSTTFAERAWCETCGTALWLRNVEGDVGVIEFSPALFPDAAGARLDRVVYADRGLPGVALAGELERVSRAEYEAENAHV